MSEEEKEFKKQCDETLRSIYSKINEEEKMFLSYVVNRFNEICGRNFKAIEYIDKMTEKELNYIIYKGEEHLVCGSDFSEGAWIIEEILKGDKE